VDEKPNIQVLERARPVQRLRPAQIERQEFEYLRHGTLHLLVGLTAHNGWIEINRSHLIAAVKCYRKHSRSNMEH